MESKLLVPKLVGVTKKYRPNKTQCPELQRNKTLTSVTKNETTCSGLSKIAKTAQQNHATMARPNQTSKVHTTTQASITKAEPKPRPKLNKWDLRGRLTYAEEDLAASKTKLKDATTRNIQLVEQVSAISEKENFEKERELRVTTVFEQLTQEQKELTSSIEKYETSSSEIEERIACIKAGLLNTQQKLNKCKKDYETHSDTLSKIHTNITQIQNDNDQHTKSITSLKNQSDELQIVLNGLQENREKMIAVIKSLEDQK